MSYEFQDTIYAPATPVARSGVSIIRISGKNALKIAAYFNCSKKISKNKAILHRFISKSGVIIDEGLCLFFQGPNSFTGEDVIELQLHGSIAVIKKMMDEIGKIEGFRIAEPGEFAKRAFLNDKLNLSQAEGLSALIDAETEMQRVVALQKSMQNNLFLHFQEWRHKIIAILSVIEAFIDFPAEELPLNELKIIEEKVLNLVINIDEQIEANRVSDVIKRGIKVAILGSANAGKSSLLNILAKRDAAIVSPKAGTTRDSIEIPIDISGFLFRIIDTAGLRDTADEIEIEGINRSIKALKEADLCFLLVDATLNISDESLTDRIRELGKDFVLIYNKMDLMPSNHIINDDCLNKIHSPLSTLMISCSNADQTYADITDFLKNYALDNYHIGTDSILISHKDLLYLSQLSSSLSLFLHSLEESIEVRCQYIRMALNILGAIMGKVDVEEILDSVFGSFCIGK